jgi:hypothetical protein
MKHTKGKWIRDYQGFIANAKGDVIADFDMAAIDIDEREANKTLACAAPRMRRALLQMQTILAAVRDDAPVLYRGKEITLEEAKYLIVDKALEGLE